MPVLIGEAIGDERNKAKGGQAGNQSGQELRIVKWYLSKKGWVVLRPKNLEIAKKIAEDMRFACNNFNIGYDQGERNTLYAVVEKFSFDCSKVVTPCECDCSSLVRVCLAYAGIKVRNFTTANEISILMATGRFETLKDAKYTKESAYLRTGDILVTSIKGHTAVVLTDGEKAHEDDPKPAPKPVYTDAYVLVLGSVNVRESAPNGKVIYTAHKGKKLPYLGETIVLADGAEWYFVETPSGNGYISAFTNKRKKYTKLVE